jgi:hypothetical protein
MDVRLEKAAKLIHASGGLWGTRRDSRYLNPVSSSRISAWILTAEPSLGEGIVSVEVCIDMASTSISVDEARAPSMNGFTVYLWESKSGFLTRAFTMKGSFSLVTLGK